MITIIKTLFFLILFLVAACGGGGSGDSSSSGSNVSGQEFMAIVDQSSTANFIIKSTVTTENLIFYGGGVYSYRNPQGIIGIIEVGESGLPLRAFVDGGTATFSNYTDKTVDILLELSDGQRIQTTVELPNRLPGKSNQFKLALPSAQDMLTGSILALRTAGCALGSPALLTGVNPVSLWISASCTGTINDWMLLKNGETTFSEQVVVYSGEALNQCVFPATEDKIALSQAADCALRVANEHFQGATPAEDAAFLGRWTGLMTSTGSPSDILCPSSAIFVFTITPTSSRDCSTLCPLTGSADVTYPDGSITVPFSGEAFVNGDATITTPDGEDVVTVRLQLGKTEGSGTYSTRLGCTGVVEARR